MFIIVNCNDIDTKLYYGFNFTVILFIWSDILTMWLG